MQVYLDNAATTKLLPEAFDAMLPYLMNSYGNPSSVHSSGREARAAIELARKNIARLLNVTAKEIIFTSGGTEAINIFLHGITQQYNHFISSRLEHPAVYRTIQHLEKINEISVTWIKNNNDGSISMDSLNKALEDNPKSLVVLMHGNNEIGNLLPLDKVSEICSQFPAMLFVDAVQTTGHYPLDLKDKNIAGLAASAHKFHGPKGVGFLYLNDQVKLKSTYKGGEQEKKLRPGTENPASIAGMSKALELMHANMDSDKKYIKTLKSKLLKDLTKAIKGVQFNGTSASIDHSLYTILSVSLPPHPDNDMLLFNLDLAGIYVSAGSACASGAAIESHVMKAIGHDKQRATVRFSFSRNNTKEEIEYACNFLNRFYNHD